MSCQCIGATEGLLLSADVASHLLFTGVVDGVLMPRKIVGSREDCVAGLASAGVDAVAAVRTSLATKNSCVLHAPVRTGSGGQAMALTVTLSLVLLEKSGSLEAKGASVVSASAGASVSGHTHGAGHEVARCAAS